MESIISKVCSFPGLKIYTQLQPRESDSVEGFLLDTSCLVLRTVFLFQLQSQGSRKKREARLL